MTFARIASRSVQYAATGASTLLVMPTGIMVGDLLLVIAGSDTAALTAITAPGSWTVLQATAGNSADMAIFARIADGTSSDNMTLVKGNGDWAAAFMRIVDHGVTTPSTDIKLATKVFATATLPDPPSLSPGSTADWLWIAAAINTQNSTSNVMSSVPTGYTQIGLGKSASSSSSVGFGMAWKAANASSENPAVFGHNVSRPYTAQTLAVPGGALRTGARIDLCPQMATTPAPQGVSTTVTAVTESFTPAPNSVILAVTCTGNSTGSGSQTETLTDSLGSTWTLLDSYSSAAGNGLVKIHAMDAGATPAARTITSTGSGTNGKGNLLAVYCLLGTEPIATILGNTFHGGPSVESTSFAVGTADSLVFGAISDSNGTGLATALTNEFLDYGYSDSTNGQKSAVFHWKDVVASPSSITAGVGTINGSLASLGIWEIKELVSAPAGLANQYWGIKV